MGPRRCAAAPAAAACLLLVCWAVLAGRGAAWGGQYPQGLLRALEDKMQHSAGNYTARLMQELISAPSSIAAARGRYVCRSDSLVPVWPISFSLPARNFRTAVPSKAKNFATVLPGVPETYVFRPRRHATAKEILMAETLYTDDMERSLFAITRKKSGWDCLRHVEILAAGAVPLFTDIAQVPLGCLAAHPLGVYKSLMKWPELRVQGFPGGKGGPRLLELNGTLDSYAYQLAAEALLHVARTTLTTQAMAEYVLQTIGAKPTDKILYLTWDTRWRVDYLGDTLLHGFKTFMPDQVADFPRRRHLYQGNETFNATTLAHNKNRLYGAGFGGFLYSLPHTAGSSLDNATVKAQILSKHYDWVIFGSAFREVPFFHEVCSTYPRSQVVFVHGNDPPPSRAQLGCYSACSDFIFAREMPPRCSRDDATALPLPRAYSRRVWPNACPLDAPAVKGKPPGAPPAAAATANSSASKGGVSRIRRWLGRY